ncbi:MAG: hypothetical protein P8R42_14695 [Candidatus Binatia bacterium]|nr:hypothetical protein [Candidatus Binatia bacterium]
MKISRIRCLLASVLVALIVAPAFGQSPDGTFTNFETGHVRPLALSPDGTRLFALNTPDNRLAIYDVTAGGLSLFAEVPVGMEPSAVAVRTNTEVWVVNHLSDSVSIVTLDAITPELSRVTRTLHTCDEPRDIVFAGPGGNRAFISTARRGQNCPVPIDYASEGLGRAIVQVFDATSLGAELGGTAIANIVLFGDTPRGLAASPDGSIVYASIFHSGNQTTAITERVISNNGGLPPPPGSALGGAPDVGLIVKFDGVGWRDELGRDWSPFVAFSLPDEDVFPIDANAPTPVALAGQEVTGVATTILNLAVNPGNGNVYATNTEDHNEVRFEGHVFDGLHGVTGRIVESSVTVINGGSAVRHHLNPHINYLVSPGSDSEIEESSAFPTDIAFSSDGSQVYVAMFGSRHVALMDSATLEGGTVAKTFIDVGGGPSGLALDEANDRLYVMNRFDHRIGIVTNASDPTTAAQTETVALGDYDPQPPVVRKGRRHLYNAKKSGHGDNACASCHHFGDQDDKAWDLGDAEATSVRTNCNPFRTGSGSPFHPQKGPMTTQSLRGLSGQGPMHWRGDRTGCATGDALDEEAAFMAFNGAFVGLLGDDEELPTDHMQEFTDFILTVRYPPNAVRDLDDVPTAQQAAGENFYFNTAVDGGNTCDHCHVINPALDFFGTDGLSSAEGETQEFKIPHLRNQYQKIGMFGVPNGQTLIPPTGFLGVQVRGFGFLHDGSIPSVNDFLMANVFAFPSAAIRGNVEAFVLSLDTGFKPSVGQQVSLTPASVGDAATLARLQLLLDQADAGNCDVIGKGAFGGEARGAVYVGFGTNLFLTDRTSEGQVSLATLLGLVSAEQEAVYTCVPRGAGIRMGIDRDGDGRRDRDEIDAGTDPNDVTSFPGSVPHVPISTKSLTMKDKTDPSTPKKRKLSFTSKDPAIVPPGLGTAGDPLVNGGTLRIYNANGSGEQVTIDLPAGSWLPSSTGFRYKGASGTAVTVITVKNGLVKLKAGKDAFGFTLDEPKQGRIAVRLTLGTGVDWCAEVPAKQKGTPSSTDKFDKVDKFLGEKNFPAPVACPVPPLGSPSGAFVDGAEAGVF